MQETIGLEILPGYCLSKRQIKEKKKEVADYQRLPFFLLSGLLDGIGRGLDP